MSKTRSEIGRANKKKGAYGQTLSAKFWKQELGGEIKSTPRSGAWWNFPGDLLAWNNIIADKWIIEVKYGKTAVPKRIKDLVEKLRDDADGKDYWLELIDPRGKTYIILDRKVFAKLLVELQGWRKNNREQGAGEINKKAS